MKLYYAPGACSLASHIAAEEEALKLDLERVDLKGHKTERGADYYRINPKGYVPALQLDDGSILTENVAVLPFLADQNPAARLAPPEQTMERFRLYEWLGYISSELHKSFAPFFRDADKAIKKQARDTIKRRLSYAADKLDSREYLLGSHFSVADAYLYVMLRWCDMADVELARIGGLAGYAAKISMRPAVRAAEDAEGLKPPVSARTPQMAG